MAIFASTTLGSGDPSRAMSIKALEARAQALAVAQSRQEAPQSMPSPWQGAGYLANTVADALLTRRADQQAAAGRQDLANTMSQIGPEGPTPQQQGQIMMRDPETGRAYMQEIAAKRAAAAEVQARKEAAATAAQTAEAAANAQETRIAGRPKTDIAQTNVDAAAGRMSEDERRGAVKKLTDPPIGEQKFILDQQKESVEHQAALGTIDEAMSLLNDPKGIHAGAGAGWSQSIGENTPKMLQGASLLPDPKTTENTQRYNQIMGGEALQALTKMKGASSDRDVQINFKIVNDPIATLDNKRKALAVLKNKLEYYVKLNNETITGAGGQAPVLPKADSGAPAAAADPLEGRTIVSDDGKTKMIRRGGKWEPM